MSSVGKHVLILGAGFGGLELATRLSETIADAVRVTLIDRNDSFFFGFSKLEVMMGRQSADDIRLPYRDLEKDGVAFRQETVIAVDPAARRAYGCRRRPRASRGRPRDGSTSSRRRRRPVSGAGASKGSRAPSRETRAVSIRR